MEKELLLKAQIREKSGSKSAAQVRKQGRIPAVVYGHREEPIAISLDAHSLIEGLHHGSRLVDVQIDPASPKGGVDKKPQKMIIKELQYDYLGKDIIHVDLMRVDVTEMVRIKVPIELKGTAKGAQEGGIVERQGDSLEVECRVTDIPEVIVVSVKNMDVGDVLHAGDIELPGGVKLVSTPSMLVATCSLVAAAKTTEELEEEVPVAPEVISEAKEVEEESSQEGKE